MGAELGSMKVTEQIEAMEVSSTHPMRFLVVTRVLAATLMIPLLVLYADGLGIIPRVASYEKVTTLDAMKAAMVAGLPVVFGFRVYKAFLQTATTGICTYPVAGEPQIGAHAVVAVGFDDATGMVKCRNSFGPEWGQAGYFYMPYQWFANMNGLVSDAWLIRPKA